MLKEVRAEMAALAVEMAAMETLVIMEVLEVLGASAVEMVAILREIYHAPEEKVEIVLMELEAKVEMAEA